MGPTKTVEELGCWLFRGHNPYVWGLKKPSFFMDLGSKGTRVSMEVIKTIVSKLVSFTYLRDVIIHLLSTSGS